MKAGDLTKGLFQMNCTTLGKRKTAGCSCRVGKKNQKKHALRSDSFQQPSVCAGCHRNSKILFIFLNLILIYFRSIIRYMSNLLNYYRRPTKMLYRHHHSTSSYTNSHLNQCHIGVELFYIDHVQPDPLKLYKSSQKMNIHRRIKANSPYWTCNK